MRDASADQHAFTSRRLRSPYWVLLAGSRHPKPDCASGCWAPSRAERATATPVLLCQLALRPSAASLHFLLRPARGGVRGALSFLQPLCQGRQRQYARIAVQRRRHPGGSLCSRLGVACATCARSGARSLARGASSSNSLSRSAALCVASPPHPPSHLTSLSRASLIPRRTHQTTP